MHRTSAASKTLVFRWHKDFQDGSANFKDVSRPGQSTTVVTNANSAAVVGLIKRDARLTVKNIAHSVGISSMLPHRLTKEQKCYLYENVHLFFYKKYQN